MKYFTIIGNHDAIDPTQTGIGAALTIFFNYIDDIDGVYIFTSPDKPHFSYKKTAEKIMRRMQAEKKGLSISIIEMDLESPVDFDLVYKNQVKHDFHLKEKALMLHLIRLHSLQFQ